MERRKKVAKLKKRLSTSYTFSSDKKKDQAELSALEGQAMAISPAGGGGGFGPQSKNIITAAINAADITLIEKERVKREASLRGGAAANRQTTNNIDARQQNTSNNMGATGQVGLKPAKLNNVNKGNAYGGY